MGEKRVGRADIIDFTKGRYDRDDITAFHMGHNPQIEITSPTTAKGLWMLEVYTEDKQRNIRLLIHGGYADEYLKGPDGKWRHCKATLHIATSHVTPLQA